MDYAELCCSITPPSFAILTIIFAYLTKEDQDLQRRATSLVSVRALPPAMSPLLTQVAKSSVALKNNITSMTSSLLSLIIVLHKWPGNLRYRAAVVVIILFIMFWRWTSNISSLPLDQITSEPVQRRKRKPGKPAFHNYTYGQLFTYLNIGLNSFLIIVIVAGQLLQTYLKPVP
jgi:uncharacterized membrane protein